MDQFAGITKRRNRPPYLLGAMTAFIAHAAVSAQPVMHQKQMVSLARLLGSGARHGRNL